MQGELIREKEAKDEVVIEVHVPSELLEFGLYRHDIQRHLLEWLVLTLFQQEKISSGKAARFLMITRAEFLALLSRRGIAYLDFSPDELAGELKAVRELQTAAQP